MHQRAFLGGGWTRGGTSEVVRRAHPASGAQWNVQVVRGKVNGKCLWNACKALSLGLLLMVLGAAMATIVIGYYADQLSVAQEVRGNHTVKIRNESRGFHLNNLSYAGPIVMGVGGFIVVAACVMTFEARDSAAKVVPARLKIGANNPSGGSCRSTTGHAHPQVHGLFQGHPHGSLKTSGSQTGSIQRHNGQHGRSGTDRRLTTESFMNFSKGLALKTAVQSNTLKCPQGTINKSPSAPNLAAEHFKTSQESATTVANVECIPRPKHTNKQYPNCALLSAGMLHRHALSVDETAGAGYRVSQDSLQDNGSQDSLALDLHLDCPVTLRIHDRRRRPLTRQRNVETEDHNNQGGDNSSRRSSHSCSPRLQKQHVKEMRSGSGGSSKRRHSNASDSSTMTHHKTIKWEHHHSSKGRLERTISSDSRLIGPVSKIHNKNHQDVGRRSGGSSSDTDIRRSSHTVVRFCQDALR